MKKIFYLFLILIFFTGCGKETAPLSEPSPVGGIISIRSRAELSNEPRGAADIQRETVTRATGDVLVYTFEAWTRDANPRRVLHEAANGTLTEAAIEIMLVPGCYDFLFWADYGKGHYDTSNLRQVTSSTASYQPGNDRDAWAGVLENVCWNGENDTEVILERPQAKLTIRNTKPFSEAKDVKVEYRNVPTCYDVLERMASAPKTVSLTFPRTVSESDLVCEDFLFVPGTRQIGLSVSVENTVKSLDVLRLEPNYKTNVTATFE